MVVTRKTPASPAGTISRTNTSQPPPKSPAKGKAPQTNGNTATTNTPNTSKSLSGKKQRHSKKKSTRSKSNSWLTGISLTVLQLLALYAFLTCPGDRSTNSLLCRSVGQYRQRVLDPYVLPPLNAALSHPSAQPYVQKAHVIQKQVEPYVVKAHQTARPLALRAGSLVLKAKEFVWDGLLVPQLQKHVVPQYNAHIDPYVSKVCEAYISNVAPHLRRVRDTVTNAYLFVKPYAMQVYRIAESFTHKVWLNIKPIILQGWRASRPYILYIWSEICHLSGQGVSKFVDARRQYVDPHVSKIWDKVAELSHKGTSSISAKVSTETEASTIKPTPAESFVSTTATIADTTSSSTAPSATPEAEEPAFTSTPAATESSEVSETHSETSSAASASASVAKASEAGPEPASSPSTSSSEALAKEPAPSASSIYIPDNDASTSIVVVTVEPSADSPAPESTPVTFSASAEGSPTSLEVPASTPSADSEDDMDDFEKELGIGVDEPVPESPEEQAARLAAELEENAKLSEEEMLKKKEELKEETAKKRVEISARHSKWELEIAEWAKQTKKDLRKFLVSSRKEAVEVIKGNTEDKTIRNLVDDSTKQGERLLKGLEGYLQKSSKAIGSGKTSEKELITLLEKWEKAVDKVKEKYEQTVREVQEGLYDWYTTFRSREIQKVIDMELAAKAKAEDAQLDLGLDYTWLDDVTYRDWQRYHDLQRNASAFGQDIRSIQNGTHPSPPIDPVPEAMNALQAEMEVIISGFETRWRVLHQKGLDTLKSPSAEVSASINSDESPAEPSYSIQPAPPVPPVDKGIKGEEDKEKMKRTEDEAFIGRGAEEVAQAFERAGDAAAVEHVEL